MKAKTITAKIRDAVQVCLMVEGDEMMRYRNIELPGEIKELEIRDFGFSINADGKIDFNLHFEKDVLPKEFPAARAKVTRAAKSATKARAAAEGTDAVKTDAMPIREEAPAGLKAAQVIEAIKELEIPTATETPKNTEEIATIAEIIEASIPEAMPEVTEESAQKPSRKGRQRKSA